jgi:type I restriction enzyme M protein
LRYKDVIDIIPDVGAPDNQSSQFQYVEVQDVSDGAVIPTTMRGWQLPDRGKHRANPGDIFVCRIWSSINKWFMASGDCGNMIVSNGFHRLRIKPGMEDYIVDIVAALNTEAYRVQGRAFATGSDGLAELVKDDLLEIVMPRITDESARQIMQKVVHDLLAGRVTVASVIDGLIKDGKIRTAEVEPRLTNWVQV